MAPHLEHALCRTSALTINYFFTMDEILAKASNQAMSFAIRSGITIASGFAIKTVSKLLDRIPASEKTRIERANSKLRTKIDIVSTSIDLIRLESARGKSALEPTIQLIEELKEEIDHFDLAVSILLSNFSTTNEMETIKLAERAIESLIASINDAIPLINLSLLTCGVSFPSSMSPKISPNRLLLSTCCIYESNSMFAEANSEKDVMVGPVFDLKLYTVFYNPSRLRYIEDDDKSSVSSLSTDKATALAVSWKEEFARALCKLLRLKGNKYAYELVIDEDFDDGRYHDDNEKPQQKILKVQDIRKQFFSASGRLLRLEGSNLPVLTLKIETDNGFDYVALGECSDPEENNSDDESDSSEYEDAKEREIPKKTKTLSLLEYLLRLASLQIAEQKDILEICDEKLSFYLSDQADGTVVPKSRSQRAMEQIQRRKNDQSLEHDSNVTRLGHLSLGGK